MAKKNVLARDANGSPMNMMPQGESVRILALDATIRFLIGDDPTAVATSPALPAGSWEYFPIKPGQKVAILGGKANISTAGV
jgi:hypothetical protein